MVPSLSVRPSASPLSRKPYKRHIVSMGSEQEVVCALSALPMTLSDLNYLKSTLFVGVRVLRYIFGTAEAIVFKFSTKIGHGKYWPMMINQSRWSWSGHVIHF